MIYFYVIVGLFILRTYVTMAVFTCTFLVVGVVFLLVVAEKCMVSNMLCLTCVQGATVYSKMGSQL